MNLRDMSVYWQKCCNGVLLLLLFVCSLACFHIACINDTLSHTSVSSIGRRQRVDMVMLVQVLLAPGTSGANSACNILAGH